MPARQTYKVGMYDMTHYISTLALGLVMMIGAITIRFITVRCLNAIHLCSDT